mgnify:CR=1 FL=1
MVETNLSIIAVVGDQMKSHQGISGKMFSTLGRNNVNIRAIAQGASERNISAIKAESDVTKALNCLHERFFETETKQINLFISGVGNVGKSLINQIEQQKKSAQRAADLTPGKSNAYRKSHEKNGQVPSVDVSRLSESIKKYHKLIK